MQLLVLRQQVVLALFPIRIRHDAAGRTDDLALRLVLGADAFRALQRVDDVHGIPRGNGLVRAYRLAGVASRAGVGDHQSHNLSPCPRALSVLMESKRALVFCLSMIFPENRQPLFGIMLYAAFGTLPSAASLSKR